MTERFLPAINEFIRFVTRALVVQAFVVVLMVIVALFALCGLADDFIVAIATAVLVTGFFCFYLLRLCVRDKVVGKALMVQQHIEKLGVADQLETGEMAEVFSNLALSVRSFPPRLITWSIISFLNRFLGYLAWQPVHTLAEVLFLASIDQHITRIKTSPTNLQYHAALANCYVMLAHHYQEPLKAQVLMPWPGIFISSTVRMTLKQKARESSTSAIEELSILKSFAPEQLWVHDQLAISYRELNMPEKEIEECEKIIELSPNDHKALLRLGMLYFRQKENAKGLEVYERLKVIQPLLADELIGHYGAYHPLLKPIL